MKKYIIFFTSIPFFLFGAGTITIIGEEVIIKEKRVIKEEPIISKEEISPSMVEKSSPSLFQDLGETLKTLPGIVSRGDFSSELYIRGAYPMETIFLLDNVFIYWPYRWGGGLLMFNTELIKKVDFYSGGYPAKGNQALGGIIDIYYKEGSLKKRGGRIQISPTTASFKMDGPFGKKLSYYLSAQRTHYDYLAKWFGIKKGISLPYFNDEYLKLYWEPTYKDKFSFGIVKTGEGMDMDMEEGYNAPDNEGHFFYKYNKSINTFNYKGVISPILSHELTLGYTKDNGAFRFYSPDFIWNGDINYKAISLRDDFIFKKKRHNINLGGMFFKYNGYEDHTFSFPIIEFVNGTWTKVKKSEEFSYKGSVEYIGLYLWDSYKFGPIVDYGIRYENNSLTKESVFSPRFSICFPIKDGSIKQSIGEYSQYPMDSFLIDEKNGNPRLKSQYSRQYIIGYEKNIDDKRIKIELYYSDLSKLILYDKEKNYINKGDGYSNGIEFFLQKKEGKRWDGWISYAYSTSKRKESPGKYGTNSTIKEDVLYLTDQDRPHVLSCLLNYNITKKWRTNLKLLYYSGNPYTPIIGCEKGSGTYRPIYGEYKSKRLPSYFKIDVTLTRKQRWGEWYIQLINITNHKNIYGYYYNEDYSERKEFKMLPFMWLGGCKIDF